MPVIDLLSGEATDAEALGAFRDALDRPQLARVPVTERDIEDDLCRFLTAEGQRPRRQVPTPAGVADVLTSTAIYEIKIRLTRSAIYSAVGQVLAYRSCLGPTMTPFVIGLAHPDVFAVYSAMRALGVRLVPWDL